MMRRWLAETATQRRPSVQMEINGRAVLQTPVFFNLQAKSLGEPLVSNTIANERKAYLKDVGVDVIEFKGYSLRGAALTTALLAGDGSDLWKELLKETGRWKDIATMMTHYCGPVGVLPHRVPPFPSCLVDAVRWHVDRSLFPQLL